MLIFKKNGKQTRKEARGNIARIILYEQKSTKQIAKQLKVSVRTVQRVRKRFLEGQSTKRKTSSRKKSGQIDCECH